MIVLHVIPSLDPRDGGPSVALPLMARALAAEGIDIHVVSTMTEADAAVQGVEFGEAIQRDGYIVRFFRRQTGFYKASLPLRRWLRAHVRDYDLLHIHAVFSFAPLVAASAARHARVPYILRPLGLLNVWGMENRRRRLKSLSFYLFDRPALDNAAAVHFTSEEERDEATRLNLKSRAVVIPLGIDLECFRVLPPAELFFSTFQAARGRDIVLFLSRLNPKKGLELLLPAFAALIPLHQNAMLVLAGEGEEGYVASLKSICADLKIENHVIWTGMLTGTLKLAAFAAAKVFVLPSHSENFGIALLEAMAAKLACVSTEGVALGRHASKEGAVILSELTKAAWRDSLVTLLEDEALRLRLAETAASLAKRDYSLETMGKSLSCLYKGLLS
jgi:glycosyltransferase involved in cell wall biosynthesis